MPINRIPLFLFFQIITLILVTPLTVAEDNVAAIDTLPQVHLPDLRIVAAIHRLPSKLPLESCSVKMDKSTEQVTHTLSSQCAYAEYAVQQAQRLCQGTAISRKVVLTNGRVRTVLQQSQLDCSLYIDKGKNTQ